MPQGKNLEHFISQLQQGIQHCTQETHRVPGSREAVVGNWGTQLQWKVSSRSCGSSSIIVVVAGILVGCLRSNRVPASSSHTSWANQVVAYYTSVGRQGSNLIKELSSLEYLFDCSNMYSKNYSCLRGLKKLLKKAPKNVLLFESIQKTAQEITQKRAQ